MNFINFYNHYIFSKIKTFSLPFRGSIDFDEYEERFIVHSILEKPNQILDLNMLAEELQLGTQRVEGLFENINKRIMKRIAQRSGSIISAPENFKLPWWTMVDSISDSEVTR